MDRIKQILTDKDKKLQKIFVNKNFAFNFQCQFRNHKVAQSNQESPYSNKPSDSQLEKYIIQQKKKNINLEHNMSSFSNKQEYLQNCVSTLSVKVEELGKTNSNNFLQFQDDNRRYGLSDITTSSTGFGNYFNSGKFSTLSKENLHSNQQSTSSTVQILQLLQSLQSMTLSNLQQLQKKFSLTYNDIESKCGNMQLKFMTIWKQAQTLINTLTYQIQSSQNKIRTLQQKISRDREFIQSNIHEFEQHVNEFVNRSNNKFIQSVEMLHQQMAKKTSILEKKLQGLSFDQQLQKVKKQLQTNLKKTINKIEQQLQQTKQEINENIQSNNKKLSNNLQTKINQKVQQSTYDIKQKITQLEHQLKQNIKNRTNFTAENISKQKNQIPIVNQNSQGSYQPWSQSVNSLQNFGMIKKQFPPPKNLLQPTNKIVSNKFLPQKKQQHHSYLSTSQLEKRFGQPQKRYEQKNEEEQTGFVRGIAGLRSLKKKQEERKGSLSRGKNRLDQQEYQQVENGRLGGMRNPLTRAGGLRPIQTIDSPSKLGKKPLPPLNSQKTFSRQPNHRQVNKYNMGQQQYSSQSQQQEGEQSYFLDEQGYLIDRYGNRLMNENGQEIQLSYEDLQRLKQLNDEGY